MNKHQTDSARIDVLSRKIDSLSSASSQKIALLEGELGKMKISENYFSDILSYSNMLFQTQTAYFFGFISIGLAIGSYFSFKYIHSKFQNISDEILKLNQGLDAQVSNGDKIDQTEKLAYNASRMAQRALYEYHTSNIRWKVIQHIRYIQYFIDKKEMGDLRKRLKDLIIEIDQLKEQDIKFISTFPRNGELRNIIHSIISNNDSYIAKCASQIWDKIFMFTDKE